MVNGEEKDLDEEEGSERKDHPLSPADWIMFLSGEMSYHMMWLLAYDSAIVVCTLAAMGSTIALMISDTTEFTIIITKSTIIIILGIFVVCLLILFCRGERRVKQKLIHLKEIRENIICEKLKNHKDILKQCEDVEVFKCKKG